MGIYGHTAAYMGIYGYTLYTTGTYMGILWGYTGLYGHTGVYNVCICFNSCLNIQKVKYTIIRDT